MAVLDETGAVTPTARTRSSHGRWRLSPLVAVLAAILLILILPPTLYLVVTSFFSTQPDGSFDQFTLRFYQQLFSSPYFAASLGNTVVYAFGSALVAIVLGVVQALIVERTNTPGRHYVFLGAVVSLGIPHVLYTVAWLLLLGRTGPVNTLIASVFGGEGPAFNVYSMWGMILVEGIGFAPLTFLLMSSVLRSTDASFEEAALMAGAGPLKTFRSITLRLGLPGVLALMLLIGIRAFESFEVPALVGLAGNVTVLTTNIYQSSKNIGAINFGEFGRLFGLPPARRRAAARLAQSSRRPRQPVPDHHRQRLSAAHDRSRPLALCHGRDTAGDLPAGDRAAGRDPGVHLAHAIL